MFSLYFKYSIKISEINNRAVTFGYRIITIFRKRLQIVRNGGKPVLRRLPRRFLGGLFLCVGKNVAVQVPFDGSAVFVLRADIAAF